MHALKMGAGPRLALAFHGYSNTASLFLGLESLLGHEFTVVAFDLPHHGRSHWESGTILEPAALKQLVERLCDRHGVRQAALLGFSLGGRVALSLLQWAPERVSQVALAAPDGLAFSPFHFFATRTAPGQRLMSHLIRQPGFYFSLLAQLRRRNWIPESRYQFFMHYLESEAARRFLGAVWPSLRFLTPSQRRLRMLIRRHRIPVHLFMGRYDKVIPISLGIAFAKGNPDVQLHILEKGHRLMDGDTIRRMAQVLREC
jgi:pimeloyl-ACP methyl ester carboxylesterase